ncbi:uncharacterized protein LOC130737074 [Lotus japonicus]|uniref:uncharacterized protein LOC130737074 n=1 Tax=Lotus japonicus TaxID=34305 RepID=UPI0025898003|nr:uncharacterized protein LOC130737074 [Lotus japonicus]
MCWNCRGTNSRGFPNLIRDLKRLHNMEALFLVETHSSGEKARKVAASLGFDSSEIVDGNGQAGGIWCLWDSNAVTIVKLFSSPQLLHLSIQRKNESVWFITAVYGKPHYMGRRELWSQILAIHDNMNDPWCLLGDFNATLHDHERVGSTNTSPRGSLEFRETVNQCGLIDAGYVGNPFTWKKGRLQERLDRVLCNLAWRLKFPAGTVYHLHCLKSDHSPLLLKLDVNQRHDPSRRPFRFQAAWLTHGDFSPFLKVTGV